MEKTPPVNPTDVRSQMIDALRIDLVGPDAGHELETERLTQSPSRWYLTGFLVPFQSRRTQSEDEQAADELDADLPSARTDEDEVTDRASARRARLPSSIGVSVLVPPEVMSLGVTASWGDYQRIGAEREGDEGQPVTAGDDRVYWQRTPRCEGVRVPVSAAGSVVPIPVPNSRGLELRGVVRRVRAPRGRPNSVPAGTRVLSLFLVNERDPAPDERKDESFAFQARIAIEASGEGFVPRPDPKGFDSRDWDDRVADLQYRDACEWAVGHGVATTARIDPDGRCRSVETSWVPAAEVEKVVPTSVPGVELGMEALASMGDATALAAALCGLGATYRAWIDSQRAGVPEEPPRRSTAGQLLHNAGRACERIEAGIALLDDPQVRDAFCTANRVMARAARQRAFQQGRGAPAAVPPPTWRPFQLAFLLMNLRGIAQPDHADRETVDLLFFPTGGGKTEAYLGLAAFTLVLRRLRKPGPMSGGVSVLMRYTLRLLTLDQLGRAATLICALELERQQDVERLGTWPFEIALWVGLAATPNRMGRKGDNDAHSARAKTIAFKNNSKKPAPIPLESCPWCGTKFTPTSFTLRPDDQTPMDLQLSCPGRSCDFNRGRMLPIVAVDEPIYRRLPCFVIATVDKLAGLPWLGRAGALFGNVDRYDEQGYYGACDPGRGRALSDSLPPPDLVIQDELHLISGPLGTMAGLYEAAVDLLSSRRDGECVVRPKIVASTATVRRAESQIRALFARPDVDVFPPPGIDRRDSFFARTIGLGEQRGRSYVGVAAQGRSLKVVYLRSVIALMGAAQRAWNENGGAKNRDNPADAYMTLVGYFNALRELGGSRRIVEDEVLLRLRSCGRRRRIGELKGPLADRRIAYDVLELTSRENTARVAETKRRLSLPFSEDGRVDVALATNMISVGLDIPRLGLMVVLGQPKSTAEYIQASSRVGRDDAKPGLVVALLNVHRPRDRSHYERFAAYHASFYRGVEATSVTPFSPRALDRGLAAVTVALARHGRRALTAPRSAKEIEAQRRDLGFIADTLVNRTEALGDPGALNLVREMRERINDLLDAWIRVATDLPASVDLQYAREEAGSSARLLHEPLDPELKSLSQDARKFRAQRSLRDVEPGVNLWVHALDGAELDNVVEDT